MMWRSRARVEGAAAVVESAREGHTTPASCQLSQREEMDEGLSQLGVRSSGLTCGGV
jgi:hypothetical protein